MLATNLEGSAIDGAVTAGAIAVGAVLFALALFAFGVMWFIVVSMISRTSGWAALGATYRRGAGVDPPGRWRRVGYAEMRKGARYKGVLRMGSDGEHLHLSVNRLFSAGHPQLAVPWSDVRIDEVSDGAGPSWLPRVLRGAPMVRLSIEGVPLTVPRDVVRALFEDAGMAPPA
ncbi:hypothetical protein Pla163_26790 [Planctomycetes bacterium Pla163]|uniref:Uncharacterized protein n=1 Tax=Rohdeia mirabilis TaxID=2528008 RepID=A0A518D259_9BACT|nr:hypothetical protein Pla163_26790 [Planctomycetes bacterium Pla163]